MAGDRQKDSSIAVLVDGLKELRSELKQADGELPKRLQKVNKALATEVAAEASGKFYRRVSDVDSRSGPVRQQKSGPGSISRSRASIRATATQSSASVLGGGPKAPAFFGHEFGGGARPATRQFPTHRGRDGYVLYPAIRAALPSAEARWNRIFDELFETREGPL